MPRRRRLRKIVAPPKFKGFRPYGVSIEQAECIELHYEEYEAIKLADYDLMKHQDAAALMGISRATFARIYEDARRKMAKALVETKEIKTVYGNAHLDKDWYLCNDCHARFTMPQTINKQSCPICASNNIEHLNTNRNE